jgi:hypothetical protein
MTAAHRLRRVGLPLVAAALIGGVLGVQFASGAGDFVPLASANPCAVRTASSVSTGIDGLTERLVLLGLDGAACRLGVSRETLTLELAQGGSPSAGQVNAVRAGLLRAVDLMQQNHSLPPASDLVGEALDRSDLNGFLKTAIRAVLDSVVDRAISTDDVLRRTVNNLDLRTVLTHLSNPDDLNRQVNTAVTKAVQQALVARLRDLL